MIKTALSLVLCFTFLSFELSGQKISYGLKVGYAQSYLVERTYSLDYDLPDYDCDETTHSLNSALGGAFLIVPFSPHWAFQPEVLYVPEGASIKGKYTTPEGVRYENFDYRLNYLQIPCLLKLFGEHWSLMGGPLFNILLSSSLHTRDLEASDFTYGVSLGFDYKFDEHYILDFRGQSSHYDIDEAGSGCTNHDAMLYVFQISLGYII